MTRISIAIANAKVQACGDGQQQSRLLLITLPDGTDLYLYGTDQEYQQLCAAILGVLPQSGPKPPVLKEPAATKPPKPTVN